MRCLAQLHVRKTAVLNSLFLFLGHWKSQSCIPVITSEDQACPNSSFFSALPWLCWDAASAEFTAWGHEPGCKSCSSSSQCWDQKKEPAKNHFLSFMAAPRFLSCDVSITLGPWEHFCCKNWHWHQEQPSLFCGFDRPLDLCVALTLLLLLLRHDSL